MEKELLKHLEFLTAIRPFRNWINLDSLKTASDYIENEFTTYGLPVSHQKWNVGKFEYTNLIASYQPNLKEKLIVGAHYDVYSNQPGADDNTSGVAGLLKLAEMIAAAKPNLPYGIEFVAFCLEEPPHFSTINMGSYIHAESLTKNEVPVVGMVCLDMIGFFSDEPNSQHYPIAGLEKRYGNVGDFIAVVGLEQQAKFANEISGAMKAANQLTVHGINFPTNDGLAGLSDHRNYWYFGYNAVMINNTAKFRNPNYHQETDTVETLDLTKMAGVVQAVFQAISNPLMTEAMIIKPKIAKDEPLTPKNDRLGFFARLVAWLKSLLKK